MNREVQKAVELLREAEELIRRMDTDPDELLSDDLVVTTLNHNEATNRVRIVTDCHLSRAAGVMEALKSNCQNLAEHYLLGTTDSETGSEAAENEAGEGAENG